MTPEEYRKETHKISRQNMQELNGPQASLASFAVEYGAATGKIIDAIKKALFHSAPLDERKIRRWLRISKFAQNDIEDVLNHVGRSWQNGKALSDTEAGLVLHTLGLMGESAEIAELVDDSVFTMNADQIDRNKALKESGDVLWYLDRFLGRLGFTLEDAMIANVEKLKARYPNGWDAAEKHYDHKDD